MARKAAIEKQKRREKLVERYWDQRQALKKIILDLSKPDAERRDAVYELNDLPRNSSKVRLRNRCLLTGRPRGNLRKFKISRICLREMAAMGLIPGLVKASW